jgi:HD-GYP domain-containing protein (c-di-GMP phosphodiesterase class II)
MPQLDEQLPAFQLTSPQGERVAVDDLVQRGPVVLAAIEADGAGDPRAEMLEDLAERLGAGRTLIVVSPGASALGSSLAASGGATWMQDADGQAFAALGLTYKRIGRTKRLGGLFVIDPDRRLRFAFMSADREAWIPGSFVLSRLVRLGAAAPAPSGAEAVDVTEDAAEPELERLVSAVGRRMGLSETELSELATATRVRDIGMATVPDEIITKDGPLDDQEWAVIRMHPERSADMLDPAPAFARVREIVRASHEHLDGSGYPHGLRGDRIPVGARILLAVESYMAMAGEHGFGGLLSEQDSLDRIKLGAGRIYDPAVVAALAAEIRLQTPAA